jgi:hypothetical protein
MHGGRKRTCRRKAHRGGKRTCRRKAHRGGKRTCRRKAHRGGLLRTDDFFIGSPQHIVSPWSTAA